MSQRAAERMHLMMQELGYQRYGIQGGDWGAFIGQIQAAEQPKAATGWYLHLSFGGGSCSAVRCRVYGALQQRRVRTCANRHSNAGAGSG